MDDSQYAELVKTNSTDEWEYQKFCVSGVIALIAACWVLMSKAKEQGTDGMLLHLSILLSIFFLILRGIRQFLNIRHNRKILDEESTAETANQPAPYPDSSCDRTPWGRVSSWLFPFEPILQISALIFFFIDAFRIL